MKHPNIGDKVSTIFKDKNEKPIEGLLMPRVEILDDDVIVVKLKNGYNIGIDKKKIKSVDVVEKFEQKEPPAKEIMQKASLPRISILHTGGTIASKVDYRTGAVVARFSPEDLLELFPELGDVVSIHSREIFQMFSEDMEPEHWKILAKEIADEIKTGVSGIIVTHGTDTMSYTSAALSFMLKNLPIPIILVGAQRSSDRGSSDAFLNLVCAARFITKCNFSGVGVCMHSGKSDDFCFVHNGVNVRKMHSSARDAFKSINTKPIARVFPDGKIEFLSEYKTPSDDKFELKSDFENKIGIVKIRPGISEKELRFFEKNDYKGLILEGTGLGHAPVTVLDTLRKMSKKMIIAMTTQCINGVVNMNVYSTGRDLQNAGVIAANMLPEVAYVKLGWALANSDSENDGAKELFAKNIAGEIVERLSANY